MFKVKIIGVSLIGFYHRSKGLPLQDFFDTYLENAISIYYGDVGHNGVIVKGIYGYGDVYVAMADGAGSAKYGGDGAKHAINGAMRFIKSSSKNNDPEYVLKGAFKAALNNIKSIANDFSADVNEFATTLAILHVSGNECRAINVGDGFIVIDDGNELKLLNEPVKGEYFNETQFITSQEIIKVIEDGTLSISRSKCVSFAMATDGLWPTVINGRPYEKFYRPIIQYLENNNVKIDDAAVELYKLLVSIQDRYPSVYDDDMTLIVGIYVQ